MERKVLHKESYCLYDCGLDPNHPCWDGKQNGYGTCGIKVEYAILQEGGKFIVVRRKIEYNTHSIYLDEHVYNYSPYRKIAEYNSFEEALQHIKEVRKDEEYKPDEIHDPFNYE